MSVARTEFFQINMRVHLITISICYAAMTMLSICYMKKRENRMRALVVTHFSSMALEYGFAAIAVFFPSDGLTYIVAYLLCMVFAMVGLFTFYAIYLYRVVTTFKDSFCAIPRRTVIVHTGVLAVSGLMMGMTLASQRWLHLNVIVITTLMSGAPLLIFIGIAHIAFVFNRNLFRILAHADHDDANVSTSASRPGMYVTDQDVVNVITKQTLLASLPAVFLLSLILVDGVAFAIGPFVGLVTAIWSFSLMMVASSYCHLVSFTEFKAMYRVTCQLGHLCMSSCCQKLAKKNKVSTTESTRNLPKRDAVASLSSPAIVVSDLSTPGSPSTDAVISAQT